MRFPMILDMNKYVDSPVQADGDRGDHAQGRSDFQVAISVVSIDFFLLLSFCFVFVSVLFINVIIYICICIYTMFL